MVDQNSASWNQVTDWLQRLELLQRASDRPASAALSCHRRSRTVCDQVARAMGKSLMADPERAPLARRAFEEYATGRYTKQQVLH